MRNIEEIINAIVNLTEDDCHNCPCIDTCKGDYFIDEDECVDNIANWVNGN